MDIDGSTLVSEKADRGVLHNLAKDREWSSASMEFVTDSFHIDWSTSKVNTQVNPTTCLDKTGCWIQQVIAPTLVVTRWIQQPMSPKQVVGFTCVFNSEVDQLIRKLLITYLKYKLQKIQAT